MASVSASPPDQTFFAAAVLTLFALSPLTILGLLFLSAPYGRHSRPGWGPSVPPAAAWFLMESPTVWLTLLLFPRGRHRSHPLALAIFAPYIFHYLNRTVIYPLRLLRSRSRNTSSVPLVIAASGFLFNVLNAYVQARSISHYADYPPAGEIPRWIWARVTAGTGVFAWGMTVNIRSDLALLRLKAASGGGYGVPRGGWFELVTCPNYMGEAAEWLGWAAAAATPAALGFFLYTCANLMPRALQHRRWYWEKFGSDYPASRKAVVPYLI